VKLPERIYIVLNQWSHTVDTYTNKRRAYERAKFLASRYPEASYRVARYDLVSL